MRFTHLAVSKQLTLLTCLLLAYAALAPTPGGATRAAAPAPLPAVVQSGMNAYLSDLPTCSATNGWGPFERDRSNGETGERDGGTITLNGVTYAKGLGVHAYSELRVCLGGAYTQLVSDIGVDDYVGGAGSVIFRVYADNVLLYDSGVMTGSSATKNVVVSAAGRQELRLVVTDAGNGADSDHGDWAGAYLVRGTPTTTTAYASDLSWLSSTNGWGPAERDLSNGETAPNDGGQITLNGVTYTKGIGMHSAYPQADLRINLAGAYTSFQASVGVDDYVGPYGSVVFRVYADGALLYDSGVMNGSSATKSVNVSVAGRNELRLVVTDGGDGGENDHADWANARLLFKNDPATAGLWCNRINWPTVAIHTHLLPDGRVLFWGRDKLSDGKTDVSGRSNTYVWDPSNGSTTTIPNDRTNLFCSGHSFLPDGRLLVSGGHVQNDGEGEPEVNIFHYGSNSWTAGPNMNAGRWYPSSVTLANGEALVLSGTTVPNVINPLPQIWTAGNAWRDLASAQRSDLPTYPWLFQAPAGTPGDVFNAGPAKYSSFISTAAPGSWSTWKPSAFGDRPHGSAVMYDNGKVLIAGGGHDEPTSTVEKIDINPTASNPNWEKAADMNYARNHLNTLILPDGKILATGGTRISNGNFNNARGSVFPAEVYDPVSNRWTPLASMKVRRLYHSTTILLPDGSVLSAGGGLPASSEAGDTDHRDMEIYLPPYLFKGPRPIITSAPPPQVGYGQTFFVGTPNPANIAKVTWIRLSSTTHSFNENQRINTLNKATVAGGLNVTAPSDPKLCPPGHYMLFILDANGVPSVAKIVRIG